MSPDQPSSLQEHTWRTIGLYGACTVLGALGGYLLWHKFFQEAVSPRALWYWDRFWSIFLGLIGGSRAGDWLADRIPRFRGSEGPGILGAGRGIAVMAAVLWRLPAESTAIIAAIAKIGLGAQSGWFLVYLSTRPPYSDRLPKGQPSDSKV